MASARLIGSFDFFVCHPHQRPSTEYIYIYIDRHGIAFHLAKIPESFPVNVVVVVVIVGSTDPQANSAEHAAIIRITFVHTRRCESFGFRRGPGKKVWV